jgi:glycosyltransferase involved in cell wall biosynthesis
MGAKLILDIHDPMPEFYMSKYDIEKRSIIVRCLEGQEQFSARVADAVIVANHNFEQNLIKRGAAPNKITVVNNVADPKIFNRDAYRELRQQPRQPFTMLYPGTIAPRYNLDIAIRALPQLLATSNDFRLQIVGPKVAHVDELVELAKELDVTEYVDFQPSIPIRSIAPMMACAGVGIYTAAPGPHMSIATPTKVLEYAAMGLPIVASRLKVLESLFPDSAILFFEPGNVEQFAQCVLHLYQNPLCRKQLVQNADRFFVQKYRWANERSTYLGLLNRLSPASS